MAKKRKSVRRTSPLHKHHSLSSSFADHPLLTLGVGFMIVLLIGVILVAILAVKAKDKVEEEVMEHPLIMQQTTPATGSATVTPTPIQSGPTPAPTRVMKY
ncbi:MAG TPA: hypothetical protein VLF68_03770 [Candidatus Saccharimonadales bacterium]|nr:hypothetical protein [Candidatus Saccharimonadales bacterium]